MKNRYVVKLTSVCSRLPRWLLLVIVVLVLGGCFEDGANDIAGLPIDDDFAPPLDEDMPSL